MEQVTLFAAFLGGILSFVSPCVLPLVPAYISFISGVSIEQIIDREEHARHLKAVLISSACFIIGFSAVFVALGATATILGRVLLARLDVLAKIAGAVIIVFGVHTTGLIQIPWLNREKRLQSRDTPAGALGSFVVGLAFAFGWTPCIGPILAAILVMAGAQESVGQGILLLSIYSLGLGVPFLLTGLATNTFLGMFSRIKRYFKAVELISGLFLIVVGLLIFF
ncbi:MAG: cytochrome c biogenesis protein CcdA, partial [Candidatus Latescibacteria bacterium]|nr:cytochrome c biogenesis protein CcdA [Candidatus Latescibacterota bacterium]